MSVIGHGQPLPGYMAPGAYNMPLAAYNMGSPPYLNNTNLSNESILIGGYNVSASCNKNIVVISATNRPPTDTDNSFDQAGTLYLRSDKGVFVETEPDKYENLCDVIKEVGELRTHLDELIKAFNELKDMWWYSPSGPGYTEAETRFTTAVQDQNMENFDEKNN